jgi:hypothetical protein
MMIVMIVMMMIKIIIIIILIILPFVNIFTNEKIRQGKA